MRILVSSYACEPGKGSEPGVGWNFVKEMSARHELTVLTRANNRPLVEGSGEEWIRRVRWIWYDPPKALTFWKRKGRGVQWFYLMWQIGVTRFVRRSFRPGDFDLVHHVTFGRYWIPSFLGTFGPPLVFGPVGGGDETPVVFRHHYSLAGRLREFQKRVAERLFTMAFKRSFRCMSLVLAATEQNAEKMRRLVSCPVFVHPQSAMSEDELADMRDIRREPPASDVPRFTTACRLKHWKAVDLAIRAFPAVLRDFPNATLDILGGGPEKRRLRRLVASLGLQERVQFLGRLPELSDVWRHIASSTALVHPALHESFGQVCLESVAIGTPVVCWNWAGPGLIARQCGLRPVPIPGGGHDLSAFSAAMVSCARTQPSVSLPDGFRWSRWCDAVETMYRRISHAP